MNFLEKDLEQIIWESDNIILQKRNLPIEGKKFRQLKIGNYGILDLMTVSKDYYWCGSSLQNIPFLNISVYELKKDKVGISAFLQAIRYCKGIKSYLDEYRPSIEYQLNIKLISKEVDRSGDFIFITDLFGNGFTESLGKINSVDFYSFEYNIDGINFIINKDYNLISKGF